MKLFFRVWGDQIKVDIDRNVVRPFSMMLAGLPFWFVGVFVVFKIDSDNLWLIGIEFIFALIGLMGCGWTMIGYCLLFWRCLPRMLY